MSLALIVSLLCVVSGCCLSEDEHASGKAASASAGGAAGSQSGAKSADVNSPATAKTVTVVVDSGASSPKRFEQIAWHEHFTALDALAAARDQPHGITFKSRGSGATAFVTEIDGLANQGGAATAKNWIFRINGKTVDEGCGTAEVKPGDVVLWKFGAYE